MDMSVTQRRTKREREREREREGGKKERRHRVDATHEENVVYFGFFFFWGERSHRVDATHEERERDATG